MGNQMCTICGMRPKETREREITVQTQVALRQTVGAPDMTMTVTTAMTTTLRTIGESVRTDTQVTLLKRETEKSQRKLTKNLTSCQRSL